jgi:hypothetical protein
LNIQVNNFHRRIEKIMAEMTPAALENDSGLGLVDAVSSVFKSKSRFN